MADGRFYFRDCIIDGDFSLGNVRDGELVDRDWSVWCNQPPDLQSFLQNGRIAWDTVARYYQCKLLDQNGVPFGSVDNWNPVAHFDTKTFRMGGSSWQYKAPMGNGLSIAIHQFVADDSGVAMDILRGIIPGTPPKIFQLQAVYKGLS